VYPPFSGSSSHWRHSCGDTSYNGKRWKNRYNILVSSVAKTVPNRKYNRGYRANYYNAKTTYNSLSSSGRSCTYPIAGAVTKKVAAGKGSNFALIAPNNGKFYNALSIRKRSGHMRRRKSYDYKLWIFVLG